jgi:hypothetical protein
MWESVVGGATLVENRNRIVSLNCGRLQLDDDNRSAISQAKMSQITLLAQLKSHIGKIIFT